MTDAAREFRRGYTVDGTTPAKAAGFVGAAVIAQLGPDDWQIGQDVTQATVALVEEYRSGAGGPHDDTDISVAVRFTGAGVTIELTGADDWRARRTVRPRKPFRGAQMPEGRARPATERSP